MPDQRPRSRRQQIETAVTTCDHCDTVVNLRFYDGVATCPRCKQQNRY